MNFPIINFGEILKMIDGGSTGSRLHIFEFVQTETSPNSSKTNNKNINNEQSLKCERRGSYKVNYPLSGFARSESDVEKNTPLNPSVVVNHLLPLFAFAASTIPSEYHSTTQVRYMATAGMRLLDVNEQQLIYDAVFQGLIESQLEIELPTSSEKINSSEISSETKDNKYTEIIPFPFHSLELSHIGTLPGDLEGFYGAVAANYLAGAIDVNLRLINKQDKLLNNSHNKSEKQQNVENETNMPLGALDMGGSSTQLVFLAPNSQNTTKSCMLNDKKDRENESNTDYLNTDDFFSTSYLSYGVDQFRERLWDTWIRDRENAAQSTGNNDESQKSSLSCCTNDVIPNPCTFKGFSMKWKGYTLRGTGDAFECTKQVRRLIPSLDGHIHDPYDMKKNDGHNSKRRVGGVEHPPIRGKFYAMSLYFFTLDSLRVLSHPVQHAYEALNLSWPNPSIQELYDALHGLCGRHWQGDLEDIQHHAHEYTRAEVLPHRCIEAVYMVTLLRDGFGFHPLSRDITFTYHIDGSEVEWALGLALSLFAKQHKQNDCENGTTIIEKRLSNAEWSNHSAKKDDSFIIPEEKISPQQHDFNSDLIHPTVSM